MNNQVRRRIFGFTALFFAFCTGFFIFHPSGRSLLSWDYKGLSSTVEPKPNAVIVMMMPPFRMTQGMMALLNIEDRFNRRLKYPYVILTEANVTEEIQNKVSWITEGRAKFAEFPTDMWGPSNDLDKNKIDESLKHIGFTTGYRSMCRFYSGFFWRHPAIAEYDWIWRLDTDIAFHCDVTYDPFVRMREANKFYAFVTVASDIVSVQPTLAPTVSAFLKSHSHLLPPVSNLGFTWKNVSKALEGRAGNDDWTGHMFYNNWEISHRSVWESNIYTAFFEHLDRTGGFFYERWGDAPVHSYGLSMALRPDQVMQFTDMGYQHQGLRFYECPTTENCACSTDASGGYDDFNSRAYQWFEAKS